MFQAEEYEYLLHEIKNYICLISGSLHLITKHHPNVQEYRHWNEVLSDIDHLSQICREFSSSTLHPIIQLQPINPTEFFCSLKDETNGLLNSSEFTNKNIQFTMNVSKDLPKMELDPVQIKHVLINLIKNASEAIFDNGIITLSTSVRNEQLYIQIQDNGCGINPDQLDKIFLPAYTTKATGTGSGLFIAKAIIESHGGKISCQSRHGEGTIFILSLPMYHSVQG